MAKEVDTEGYTLRKLPYWISPLTRKDVWLDTYLMLGHSADMTWADIYGFGRERRFLPTNMLRVMGEFERKELLERQALFRTDPTQPTQLRLYVRRRYTIIELLPYKILERVLRLRIIITFSIETGIGHQVPFEAEVTCNTILPEGVTEKSDMEYYVRRIVNAVLKFFWVIFDSFKDIRPAKAVTPGSQHERALRWAMWLQNYAEPVEEENVDRFLQLLINLGVFLSQPSIDNYVVTEAVITIGVEYEPTEDVRPQYPRVDVDIEKVRTGTWYVRRLLIVADKTDIDIAKLLGITVNIEWRV